MKPLTWVWNWISMDVAGEGYRRGRERREQWQAHSLPEKSHTPPPPQTQPSNPRPPSLPAQTQSSGSLPPNYLFLPRHNPQVGTNTVLYSFLSSWGSSLVFARKVSSGTLVRGNTSTLTQICSGPQRTRMKTIRWCSTLTHICSGPQRTRMKTIRWCFTITTTRRVTPLLSPSPNVTCSTSRTRNGNEGPIWRGY